MMTPRTKTEIQQAALNLNNPEQPFIIEAVGDQMVGKWNILDAKYLGVFSANNVQKDYTITIDLNELNHTYTYIENSTSSDASIGAHGLSVEASGFKGKQLASYSTGIEIGFGMKNKNKPVEAVGAATYSFNNRRIKDPLLNILQQAGWTENKGGFFKKLFGF